MKTTIDIPEALYREAKIRAVEESSSLKDIVIQESEREQQRKAGPEVTAPQVPYFARRKLLSSFARPGRK